LLFKDSISEAASPPDAALNRLCYPYTSPL
jgi:hypothetical protein